jgi:hypothetical protein
VESITAQPSKWINSISTSGVPSQTQPAFADISGTLTAGQQPSTTVNAVMNDTNVHGSISAQTITISWNGLLGLARGGLNADLSATGGTSQVLKQTAAGASITVAQLAFSDISGTAASGQIPSLDASKITTGTLSTAQIPNLDASKITSGTLSASLLPNPSASTLGGIESIAAVSHKWINSINTSGIPSLTQPDYSDLTGTPQLAITFGAVAHEFLTSYSATTGLFTAAQPAFSDISGTISSGQLPARTASINFVIDGGGSVPSTGAWGQISVPVGCTVTGWVLTGDASGSAVVDVLRSTYSGFPTTSSIAGTDKPTLSSAQKNENLSISAWSSTSLSAGDQLQINLNSVTTCKRLNLTLIVSVPWS